MQGSKPIFNRLLLWEKQENVQLLGGSKRKLKPEYQKTGINELDSLVEKERLAVLKLPRHEVLTFKQSTWLQD